MIIPYKIGKLPARQNSCARLIRVRTPLWKTVPLSMCHGKMTAKITVQSRSNRTFQWLQGGYQFIKDGWVIRFSPVNHHRQALAVDATYLLGQPCQYFAAVGRVG